MKGHSSHLLAKPNNNSHNTSNSSASTVHSTSGSALKPILFPRQDSSHLQIYILLSTYTSIIEIQWQITLPINLNLLLFLTAAAPLPGLPNSPASLLCREPVAEPVSTDSLLAIDGDIAKRQASPAPRNDNSVPYEGWTDTGSTIDSWYGGGATEESIASSCGWGN